MIRSVVFSRRTEKQLDRLPQHIAVKLLAWVKLVEKNGLEEVRKTPGFHDEPLSGPLQGLRSIRLSRSYRAYYRVVRGEIEFVYVEGVDRHEYKG